MDIEKSLEKKRTASVEDYLKIIYVIEQDEKEIRVTDIAAALSISKASVNKAMKLMQEDGLIVHEHYGPILLTEEGRQIGKDVMDNYKVCYKFLTQVLDVEEEQAAQEAHLMEHALSKSTRKKLKKFVKKQK